MLGLFTCAKNEDKYISEWVYYHLKLGFDKIVIYDNSDDNSLMSTHLKNDTRIEIHHKPNENNKFEHHLKIDEFIQNEKTINRFKYIAVLDVDEFIVLKKHKSIKEFMNFINLKEGCLGINWMLFGSNNNKEYSESFVLNRFTRCNDKLNNHVKCISVLRDINNYTCCPHHPNLKRGCQINENGKELYKIQNEIYKHNIINKTSSFQLHSTNDYIQINHYSVKSIDEFNNRFSNHHTRTDSKLFLEEHDTNKVIDKTALIFLLKDSEYNLFDYHFYITYYSDLLINGIINEELAYSHFKNEGLKENRLSNLNYDYKTYKKNNNSLLSNEQIWKIVRQELLNSVYNIN